MSAPACRQCPHPRDGHRPYIPGGDRPGYCASCKCHQYRPQRPWPRFLAWLRESPPPVQVYVVHPRPVPFPVRDRSGDDDWDASRTRLNIPRWRPYAGAVDEARLRVPRPRGGSQW